MALSYSVVIIIDSLQLQRKECHRNGGLVERFLFKTKGNRTFSECVVVIEISQ